MCSAAKITFKYMYKNTVIDQLLTKDHIEMHDIVAECMIFANNAVAIKIAEVFPALALLRHHPAPSAIQFQMLATSAAVKGFTIDPRYMMDSLHMYLDRLINR